MFKLSKLKKEIIFWLLLISFLFLFEAYDRGHPHLHWEEIIFIMVYFLASLFISYFIIPRFLYKKKFLKFSLSIIAILAAVGFFEEFVLEPIFYPISRAVISEFIPTLLDILPPILLFTGFKFAWDALDKEHKIEKMSRLAAEQELQFLNSQINPHFLFNNLNNLYASALEQSPDTPKIILQLSDILRYMLYDCRKPLVSLKSEVEHLNQFIELYKMQMQKDTTIDFTCSPISEDLNIAPLMLIVFVENAFKHSQSSQTEAVQITISIEVKDQSLHFICKNNFSKVSNTDNLAKGIGLENVKQKLRLLYEDRHQLQIDQDEQWYQVNLKLELND